MQSKNAGRTINDIYIGNKKIIIKLSDGSRLDILPFTYTNNTEMELIYNGFDGDTTYNNTVKNETGCLKTEMKKWVTLLNGVNSKTSETTSIEGLGFSKYCTRHNDIRKTIKATCTEGGCDRYTCIMCGTYYYTNTTKAKGHKYTTKVVKPTYAAKGYTLHTCSVCRKSYKDKYTNKLKVAKPTISKVASPKSKQIKVTWGKKSYTGYQVQIATNSKFTKNKKSATIKSAKTVTKTFTKLKGKKKYYVRVRAYKTYHGKKYYSAWSKVKTVKTKK